MSWDGAHNQVIQPPPSVSASQYTVCATFFTHVGADGVDPGAPDVSTTLEPALPLCPVRHTSDCSDGEEDAFRVSTAQGEGKRAVHSILRGWYGGTGW